MSMDTNVAGFRPPDEEWKKMKIIWDAYERVGVEMPKKIADFFGGIPPDPAGVEIGLNNKPCCKEYREEMRDGYEIEIAKLPRNIQIIRFWNNY